jgi:AAA+ ATPase superfamily predicted ATPase
MALPFIDRDQEKARLARVIRMRGVTLTCLYGRRRCGKTRLLREVLSGTRHVLYVGDDRAGVLQLRALAREISRMVPGFERVEYPGWDELLDRWWEKAPDGAVLALDEFPSLVAHAPEVPSLLQKHLDSGREMALHTVICGSSQQMMYGLVLDETAPLYGRCQEILKIGPMGVRELGQALDLSTAREAVERYAVWGGIPRYWELAASFPDGPSAVRELVLDPMGVLHQEPERLLRDDARETTRSSSILVLIGQGCHRLSEIAARLGRPATELSRPLSRLVGLGLVVREVPFGVSARDSRRSFYRIADPFLRFWFRFVEPERSRLAAGAVDLVEKEIAAGWSGHLGSVWEDVVRGVLGRVELDRVRWVDPARWWGTGSDGRPLELDLLARSESSDLLLAGEVKVAASRSEVPRLVSALDDRVRRCPEAQGRSVVLRIFLLRPPPGRLPERVVSAEALLGRSGRRLDRPKGRR